MSSYPDAWNKRLASIISNGGGPRKLVFKLIKQHTVQMRLLGFLRMKTGNGPFDAGVHNKPLPQHNKCKLDFMSVAHLLWTVVAILDSKYM